MFWPCETRTSTCRSFATISSGLYRFLAIAVLLDVKDIPQVGPLQWGGGSLVDGVQGHLSRQTVSEPPWLTARYMSKNRPDAGTFDIPIQRAIFGQKVRGTSRNVRHKHHRRQKSSA